MMRLPASNSCYKFNKQLDPEETPTTLYLLVVYGDHTTPKNGQTNTLHTICLTSKHQAPQTVQKFSGLSNNVLTMMRAT